MFDAIREHIPQLKDDWERYQQLWHRMEVAPKTTLLQEGDVSKKAYYIQKGCLRVWFNNNGKDVTFQFFFENEGVSSIESFAKNQPSLFSIEAIEPSVIYWIHKHDYDTIFAENPAMKDYLLDVMLDRQINYMRHFLSSIKDTPRERYRKLIEERPHIVQRIPQHYIASYLGITPVSLSRIRNRI